MKLEFNYYGLFVGLGLAIVVTLVEKIAKTFNVRSSALFKPSLIFGCGAFFGARFWHILTTPLLYLEEPWRSLAVWQGGLSIWGAIWGGLTCLWVFYLLEGKKNTHSTWRYLDLLSFSLPAGQVIGRLGNWFNQELYGFPSNLPWSIAIDRAHRLPGFESIERYHPLFAYEALAMLAILLVFWLLPKHKQKPGQYFTIYLVYYTLIRFLIEFLRLDKLPLINSLISFNQLASIVFLLCFILFSRVIYQSQES